MPTSVTFTEARARLSVLVDRASEGEEFVITRAGAPVARLLAYRSRTAPRAPGLLRGQIWIAEDFDDTPAGLIDDFES